MFAFIHYKPSLPKRWFYIFEICLLYMTNGNIYKMPLGIWSTMYHTTYTKLSKKYYNNHNLRHDMLDKWILEE